MNTVSLSRLLARHLAVDNPARLGGDAALDVLSAINAGLQQFYAEAPARLKRVSISRTIRAVADVAVTVSAQYSRTLTGTPFSTAQLGCTVQFPGLVVDNEVAGVSSLLDEHLSPTLSATVRVFHDAIALASPIERLASDVRVYGAGCNVALQRSDRLRAWRAVHREGPPEYYQFEERAVSLDGSPAYLFRVWPLPVADYTVRFEAECGPARVTFSNLVTPIELPILDSVADDILVPLCTAHLTASPLWRDATTINRAVNTAAEVLGRRIPMLAHDTGVPNNTVGTPVGY